MSAVEEDSRNSGDEEEEEEEECRVCRGPAEEGRNLFAPCKCSGSIGLTHQDCLTSWLAVTRGDGKCELCSTKFQFAPKYAEGAPERLPPHEVVLGVSRSLVARWMPFLLRIVASLFLWFVMLPLLTAYIYHGWMHRPSSVLTRLNWELLPGDIISGAVVVGVIIVSFLSFMSFTDFLRVRWGNPQNNHNPNNDDQQQQNNPQFNHNDILDQDVDDVVLDHNHFLRRQRNRNLHAVGVMDQRQPVFAANRGPAFDPLMQDMPNEPAAQRDELRRRIQAAAALQHQLNALEANVAERDENIHPQNRDPPQPNPPQLQDHEHLDIMPSLVPEAFLPHHQDNPELASDQEIQAIVRDAANDHTNEEVEADREEDREDTQNDAAAQRENEDTAEARLAQFLMEQEQDDEDHENDEVAPQQAQPADNNNDRFEPRFEPLDPVINVQEEQIEMEMNIAIDELFGLRGPFGTLLRNLLWFLVFNACYLGIFACIPSHVGSLSYDAFLRFNSLSGSISFPNATMTMLTILNNESERLNTTFKLPDLATVAFGYFTMAVFILSVQWFIKKIDQFKRDPQPDTGETGDDEDDDGIPAVPQPPMRPHLEHPQIPPDDDDIVIHGTLSTLMDCIAAVVKVCVLLFLKMLLLPLLLGIWLDGATLSAFDKSVGERILFAGGDLFSFLLVHWVTGITFMLLVTVSVLQLREVIHPTLLARVIRPQEPQPDLLGNLLNESGPTHAKRMLLSFAIYAALLIVHVWLPAQLLSSCRVTSALPFLRPKFYHILSSQLQIPLELLIFHLTMLGFLEKYKNNIGAIQHSWLTFICHRFGLAQHLLPHSVARFQLVGTKAIFVDHSKSNDQFLSEDDAATDRTPGLTGVTVVTTRSDGATTAASDVPITPTQSSASPPQWVSNPNAAENLRDMNQVDPFWYELAYKKDSEAEDFITQNMEKPPQLKLEAPKEKENGECVVCNSKDYIRLPLPSSEQDVVDRKKRRSGGNARRRTSERKNVICTTQGTYRLRRAVRNDGVTVVEFWQECPGTLIVRPPEGWDDLREGSAEVQGRWAWGTEKRSKTEAGVACRKRFFGIDVAKSSTAVLLMRTVFLLLLSWLAIVLFVCIALSAPVWVGRSILTALRVSPDRIHDPLAFAIGVVIFGPTATAVVRKMNESAETPRVRIHKWMTKFNFPSTTKMFAFVASVVSWFVVFPLLSGILYELLFVKISADFGGESNMNLLDELSQFWRSGLVIFHVWAIMCYLKAFTPQFWMDLGNAIVFVDDEEGRPNGEVRNPGDEGSWQGSCGKVGRLLTSFSRVVIGWEWDVIDSSQLKEVLLPILFNLSCAVLFPSFSYFCWRSARNVMGFSESGTLLPIAGEITEGLYRLVVYRILVLGSIMFQLALGFQSELQGWFEIVHKTARDDRYLTGQVLLNWSPEIGNTGGRRN